MKNAFLHGHLKETMYMHQPSGFVIHPYHITFASSRDLYTGLSRHLMPGIIDLLSLSLVSVSQITNQILPYLSIDMVTTLHICFYMLTISFWLRHPHVLFNKLFQPYDLSFHDVSGYAKLLPWYYCFSGSTWHVFISATI